MERFARGVAFGLLLAAIGVGGCNGSAAGLLTGATAAAPETGSINDDTPERRPFAVAWTAARAERCGFYFDPGRLRASYIAYESRQSPPEVMAKVEKTYDATFKTIRATTAANPDYCTDSKSAEIKKDLTRHLAGDFKPNLPKPKKEETCGFLGAACAPKDDGKWDTGQFWDNQQKNVMGR